MRPTVPEALKPFLNKPLRLFVADRPLRQQLAEALAILRFAEVSQAEVNPRYFPAMQQLHNELKTFDGLILVNHPLKTSKTAAGLTYQELDLPDFYGGVWKQTEKAVRNPLELMSRCVPVFTYAQDSDIRQRAVQDLYPFGVQGVFMLRVQPLDSDYEQRLRERVEELGEYLAEYFLFHDHKLAEMKEYKSAEELAQRRAQAEELMSRVEALKQAGDYDQAVALCQEAIKALPTQPEAYLEGGRLLVRLRRYPPALQLFRDAEAVSARSPLPNQEVANLRLAQVRELAEHQRKTGKPVNPELIDAYLREAQDNFAQALVKAEQVVLVDANPQARAEARKQATALVVESILSQDLSETLGPGHPVVHKLLLMASEAIDAKLQGEEDATRRFPVQLGLLAYQKGDLKAALRLWLQAAEDPAQRQKACQNLNFLGTHLRQTGRLDEAVGVYQKLLALNPSFKGVVKFNLAVALAAKARDLSGPAGDPSRAQATAAQAAATAVEAIYVDPYLPQDRNFYVNRVIKSGLEKAASLVASVVSLAGPGESGSSGDEQSCQAACLEIESHLARGDEKAALNLLLGLAQEQRQFFLCFDRHASQAVADFAQRLHPLLSNHDQPRLRALGQVLGVLLAKHTQVRQGPDPRLAGVLAALENADQALAARALVEAILADPVLTTTPLPWRDPTLINLAREINAKLAGIDFSRF